MHHSTLPIVDWGPSHDLHTVATFGVESEDSVSSLITNFQPSDLWAALTPIANAATSICTQSLVSHYPTSKNFLGGNCTSEIHVKSESEYSNSFMNGFAVETAVHHGHTDHQSISLADQLMKATCATSPPTATVPPRPQQANEISIDFNNPTNKDQCLKIFQDGTDVNNTDTNNSFNSLETKAIGNAFN